MFAGEFGARETETKRHTGQASRTEYSMKGKDRHLSTGRVSAADPTSNQYYTNDCLLTADSHARSRLTGRKISVPEHTQQSGIQPQTQSQPYSRKRQAGTFLCQDSNAPLLKSHMDTVHTLPSPTTARTQMAGFAPALPYVVHESQPPISMSPGRYTRQSPDAEGQNAIPVVERERYVCAYNAQRRIAILIMINCQT